MKLERRGVTRTVLLTGSWAVKVPTVRHGGRHLVRGWLANQSEWRRRHTAGVNPPVLNVANVMTVQRAAHMIGHDGIDGPWRALPDDDATTGDERKPDSWGLFELGWLLIDFDRAWQQPAGLVARAYYWNEARKARRWARLPLADPQP